MTDHPDAHELSAALEGELHRLAEVAPRELRIRLLVAAHAAGLIARDDRVLRGSDDRALAEALRRGEHDQELLDIALPLRHEVAERLKIASPGYGK